MSTSTLDSRIDELFTAWDSTTTPGCGLGVALGGQWIFRRDYGMADLEHDVPIGPGTVFDIGSVSKQFTATAVLLADEEGLLSLEDDIRIHLPELPDLGVTITLRSLLQHQGGLRCYLDSLILAGTTFDDFFTVPEAFAMVRRQRSANFAPGTQFSYCNTGFFLMSIVIERATGKSLRVFADENIFGPLGMRNSFFHDDHLELVRHRALGHTRRPQGEWGLSNFLPEVVGDGSIQSTVDDLLLWERNLRSNRLGRRGQGLVEELTRPACLVDGTDTGYGLGIEVFRRGPLAIRQHAGVIAGYRSFFLSAEEPALSVVCLANCDEFALNELCGKVARIALEECAPGGTATPRPAVASKSPAKAPSALRQEPIEGISHFWSLDRQLVAIVAATPEGLVADLSGYSGKLEASEDGSYEGTGLLYGHRWTFAMEPGPSHDVGRLTICRERGGNIELERMEPAIPSPGFVAACAGEYHSAELATCHRFVVSGGSLAVETRFGAVAPLTPLREGWFQLGNILLHFQDPGLGPVRELTIGTERARRLRFERR